MDRELNPRLKIWDYKGKEILYSDVRDLKGEEFIKTVIQNHDDELKLIKEGYKEFRMLVDVRGCYATPEVISVYKKNAKDIKPYIKKSAVVGITGIKKILLKSVCAFANLSIKPFDTIEEAKNWLIEE